VTQIERLEEEIERSRARLEETIDAIQGRLSVSRLIDDAMGSLRKSQFGAVLERAVGAVRRNPVPAMVAAAGLGWLFYRVAQDSRRPDLSWAGKMEEESVPVLVTGQDRVYDPDSSPRHPTQDLVETRRDMSARA
jgi:hypothetical protein